MDAKIDANREKMEARIDNINEKFEVLWSTRLLDGYPPSQDRDRSRRNNSQDGHPSGMDESQYECLLK
jgi:hypothetical protein